jgi:hypothetical protein
MRVARQIDWQSQQETLPGSLRDTVSLGNIETIQKSLLEHSARFEGIE